MQPKKEKTNSKKETSQNPKVAEVKHTKNDKNVNKTDKTTELGKKKKQKKFVKKLEKTKPVQNKNVPHIIPKSYPDDLIIKVKNLPERCKQSDIISAFTRFGSLTYIQKTSDKNALIGFLEREEAEAARKAGRILVRGQKVVIGEKKNRSKSKQFSGEKTDSNRELLHRTVLVYRMDSTTTEDDIKEHFKQCGRIESITLFQKKFTSHFKITFENGSSAEEALKLHNSILKETNIHVRRKSDEPVPWDLKRSIVLLNPNGLTKVDGSKLKKLFEDCGEVEKFDVFCYKNRLATLSFKHENSIQKALRLNGTTKHGIPIEIELYSDKIQKHAVPVQNVNETLANLLKKSKKCKVCIKKVSENLTERDIFNLFETCGPVKSVTISDDRSAVIEFETIQGYCKAFTLHACVFGGKKLILMPYSEQDIPNFGTNKSQKGKRNLVDNEDIRPPKKLQKKV